MIGTLGKSTLTNQTLKNNNQIKIQADKVWTLSTTVKQLSEICSQSIVLYYKHMFYTNLLYDSATSIITAGKTYTVDGLYEGRSAGVVVVSPVDVGKLWQGVEHDNNVASSGGFKQQQVGR